MSPSKPPDFDADERPRDDTAVSALDSTAVAAVVMNDDGTYSIGDSAADISEIGDDAIEEIVDERGWLRRRGLLIGVLLGIAVELVGLAIYFYG